MRYTSSTIIVTIYKDTESIVLKMTNLVINYAVALAVECCSDFDNIVSLVYLSVHVSTET